METMETNNNSDDIPDHVMDHHSHVIDQSHLTTHVTDISPIMDFTNSYLNQIKSQKSAFLLEGSGYQPDEVNMCTPRRHLVDTYSLGHNYFAISVAHDFCRFLRQF